VRPPRVVGWFTNPKHSAGLAGLSILGHDVLEDWEAGDCLQRKWDGDVLAYNDEYMMSIPARWRTCLDTEFWSFFHKKWLNMFEPKPHVWALWILELSKMSENWGPRKFDGLTMAAFSVGTRWAAGFCGSPWLQHVATLGDLIFLMGCMLVLWVTNRL